MEFSWPGEKLLIKLCDTVAAKGIGSLLKPWQMRREGAAAAEIKRLNSLTVAQTKMDTAAIAAGRKVLLTDGKLAPANIDAPDQKQAGQVAIIAELEDILATTIRTEAFRKEVSVAKAILYAEQELEQETGEVTDTPVSDDWLYRWRDNASSVSSDELQMLWGKVLAGEVKSPGAFSLRTLEFLRNISREDAALIERLAPYVISQFVFRPAPPNALVGSLQYAEFMQLQELGILSGVEATGMRTDFSSDGTETFVKALPAYGRVIVVKHDDINRKLMLPVYIVTRLGVQILALGWKHVDEEYLASIARRIKEMDFEVYIGNCRDDGQGALECTDLVRI